MKEKNSRSRWIRGFMAAGLGFIMIACILPSMGAKLEVAPQEGMWRWGPYVFYPAGLFTSVGLISLATICTIIGAARDNHLETAGWLMFGGLFVVAMM